MTGPRDPEPPGEPGRAAQEADPTLGPGTDPDAEAKATDDEATPGGRP